MKKCPRCGIEKPLEEFAINNTTPKKIYRKRHCKVCYQNLWEERKLIRKTAPPPPKFCQCCGKEKKLKLDHISGTLKFRGWICNECNIGIGLLGDNIEGLKIAIRYLRECESK
jgi:hypothetical protein